MTQQPMEAVPQWDLADRMRKAIRHAAAGAWHEIIDITDIRPLLGHASLTTTQRYVPARQHAAIRAVNAAAQRLAS